jgi:predicted negative regulator of RcsB-dependent stress response
MTASNFRWLLVGVCLSAFFIVGWSGYGQRQARSTPSWQYKMVFVQEKDFGRTEEILNEHGAKGWELVQRDTWERAGNVYYMKRIK